MCVFVLKWKVLSHASLIVFRDLVSFFLAASFSSNVLFQDRYIIFFRDQYLFSNVKKCYYFCFSPIAIQYGTYKCKIRMLKYVFIRNANINIFHGVLISGIKLNERFSAFGRSSSKPTIELVSRWRIWGLTRRQRGWKKERKREGREREGARGENERGRVNGYKH